MSQTPKAKVVKKFTKYVTRMNHPYLPRFDENLKLLALASILETRDAVFNVLYKRLNQVNGLMAHHGVKAASVFLFLVAVRHKETLEDFSRLRVAARKSRNKLHIKKNPKDVSNATQQILEHLLRVIDVDDDSYGLHVSALLFENIAKNEKAKSGVILDYDKKTKVHDLIYNIKPDLSSLTLVEKYFYNKNKKEIYPEPAQNIKRFNNLDSFTDKKESNDIDDNIDNSVKEGSVNSEISKINILNEGALFDDSDDLNDYIDNCMKEGSEKSEIRTHNEGAEKNELEELKANEVYVSEQSYSDDNIFDDIKFYLNAEESSKTVENKK